MQPAEACSGKGFLARHVERSAGVSPAQWVCLCLQNGEVPDLTHAHEMTVAPEECGPQRIGKRVIELDLQVGDAQIPQMSSDADPPTYSLVTSPPRLVE